MKINPEYILIATTVTIVNLHAMEYALSVIPQKLVINDMKPILLPKRSHYKPLFNYQTQLHLPNEILNKIIVCCSRTDRQHLKETCKQLCFMSSINRLDAFIAHDFYIGNEKEKLIFFQSLIKTNNPYLIAPMLSYAQKEALSCSPMQSDAVCIDIITNESLQKEYIQQHYLNPLLKEALKQGNMIIRKRLEQENIDTVIINNYDSMQRRGRKCIALITGAILIATGACTWLIFALATDPCNYNKTMHCID